jgi:hypothetical protein
MPLFSVIIPAYNRARLLPATLASVFSQEFEDYEVIAVDDGSTDETRAVLEAHSGRVCMLRQDNRGPGAARNLGLQHARGEYIAFLDSDDLWYPWTLATYWKIIEHCGRPSVIAGRLRYFAGNAVSDAEEPLRYDVFGDYLEACGSGLYVGSGQMAVCTSALRAIGGFGEELGNAEDHDLALRLGAAAGFVCVHSPVMVAYRQHAECMTADVGKTLAGVSHLLGRERAGGYPGGRFRRLQRQRILACHARAASLAALDGGRPGPAWQLYRSTLPWHLRQGRWKYLFGFPLRALQSRASGWLRPKPHGVVS